MTAGETLAAWLRAAVSVVAPPTCVVCGTRLSLAERFVCTDCMLRLPRLNRHVYPFAEMTERFAPYLPDIRVCSWFAYQSHTPYTGLITMPKYAGWPDMSEWEGRTYAKEILSDIPGYFDGIDLIVPIPVSRFTRLKRGFNQSRRIADGVSSVTGIPVADILAITGRKRSHKRLNREERLGTVGRETYAVTSAYDRLPHRHILIVDDVITTGATVETAIPALCGLPDAPTHITVLTLGATSLSQ